MTDSRLTNESENLFRSEALQFHRSGHHFGTVLRIAPVWVDASVWSLSIIAIASLGFAVLSTVDEYAAGPAVVRLENRVDVTSRAAGNVTQVYVNPGQRITTGARLVQLDDEVQRQDLLSVEREYDLELLTRLRDPAAAVPQQTFSSVRARLELARAALADRTILATATGSVGDVRIRAGQRLSQGDVAVSVVPDQPSYSLIALLPGAHRPLLRLGMPMRLEFPGFPYAYQVATIAELSDDIVGPTEAQRFLGRERFDAIHLEGPQVIVKAPLKGKSFVAHGKNLQYFDGLQVTAEARLRSERLIVAVLPLLRAVFDYAD